jgi:hypothetical protein
MPSNDEFTHDERFSFTPEELLRLENRWKSDVDLKLDRLDRRTAVIERLVWIAVGASIILSAISTVGMSQMTRYAEAINDLMVRQAEANAERKIQIEGIRNEINRIQNDLNKERK